MINLFSSPEICFIFIFPSGGEEGAKGSNSLLRRDGVVLNLGAKCSVPVHAGVRSEEFYE